MAYQSEFFKKRQQSSGGGDTSAAQSTTTNYKSKFFQNGNHKTAIGSSGLTLGVTAERTDLNDRWKQKGTAAGTETEGGEAESGQARSDRKLSLLDATKRLGEGLGERSGSFDLSGSGEVSERRALELRMDAVLKRREQADNKRKAASSAIAGGLSRYGAAGGNVDWQTMLKESSAEYEALDAEYKDLLGRYREIGGDGAAGGSWIDKYKGTPISDYSWKQFGKDMAYNAERVAAGLLGGAEDVTDFIGSGFYDIVEGVSSLGGLAPNAVSEWAGRAADSYLENSISDDYEESIRRRYNPNETAEATSGLAQNVAQIMADVATGKAVSKLTVGGAGLIDDAARAAKEANLSKGVFGTRVAGGGTNEAYDEGASSEQALIYGAASGVVEVLTESIAGGIPGLGEGKLSQVVKKVVNNPAVSRVLDALGEGGEEWIATFASPFIKRAVYDKDAELATADELAESVAQGILLSGMMQAGADIPAAISAAAEARAADRQRGEEESTGPLAPILPGNEEGRNNTSEETDSPSQSAPQAALPEGEARDAADMQQKPENAAEMQQEQQDAAPAVGLDQTESLHRPSDGAAEQRSAAEPERKNETAPTGAVETERGDILTTSPADWARQETERRAAAQRQEGQEQPNTLAQERLELARQLERGEITGVEYDEAMEALEQEESLGDLEMTNLRDEGYPYRAAETRQTAERQDAEDWWDEEAFLRARDESEGGVTRHEESEGEDLSHGSGQWADRQSAGEQAGAVAESTGRTEKEQRAQQIRAAVERRDRWKDLRQRKVTSRELGLESGTDTENLMVMPESIWDEEQRRVAETVKKKIGCEAVFVLGSIEIRGENGVMKVRGVYAPGERVLIQCDNLEVDATRIAGHETFHDAAVKDPRLVGTLEQQIAERFDMEEFGRIVERYIEGYKGIIDIPEEGSPEEQYEAYQAILEEIFADAYGGIDSFGAKATAYTETVRTTTEERATDRENARAVREKTGPPKTSFAGERAKGVDLDALSRAEELESRGVADETIRQETGWFRGADGKWRWEIDDSGMSVDSPEWNYVELKDLIDHPAMFKAYPDLRRMEVTFQRLDGPVAQYNRQFDCIDIDYSLKGDSEGIKRAVLHEIQHAIQGREGFSRGATEEYWNRRIGEGFDSRRAEDREAAAEAERKLEQLRAERPEFYADMMGLEKMTPTVPRAEIDEETWEPVGEDPVEWQRYDARREELEEKYGEMAVWDFNDLLYDRERLQSKAGRTGGELYWDTAGEIEARDAASRRNLTSQERWEKRPDTGNEDTVFAEDSGWNRSEIYDSESAGIKEQIENSKEKLNSMPVIARATVPTDLKNKDSAAKWAAERLENTSYRVDRQGYGEIFFDKKALDKGLRYADTPAEKAALAVLPQVLKRGIEIGAHNDHKGRSKQTFTLAAPVELNGIRGNMAVVVNRKGSRYYAHRIVMPDGTEFRFEANNNDAAQELSRGVTVSGSLADTTSAASEISVADKKSRVKQKFSAEDTPGALAPILPGNEEGRNNTSEETELPSQSSSQTALPEGESRSDAEQREIPEEIESLPAKARGEFDRIERKLTAKVGRALSVPRFAQRDYLRQIVRELGAEFLRDGTVSEETAEKLFRQAWEQGKIVDDEFYSQYKGVKDYLRQTAVTISEGDRQDIPDWNSFRKQTFGTLRIVNQGGLPVDTMYEQLRDAAPELFPESYTAPSDQLRLMYQVGRSIRVAEYALNDYHGSRAGEFEVWARNDFQSAINESLGELRQVKRYAEDRAASWEKETAIEMDMDDLKDLYKTVKQARRNVERVSARNLLTRNDQLQVNRLLRGDITEEMLDPKRDNVKGIKAVFEAKLEYEGSARLVREWNRQRKEQLRREADEHLRDIDRWKDKKIGLAYARETMERNVLDIADKAESAKAMIRDYFTPVHKAVAAATRTKNNYRQRVKKLDLKRKAAEGNKVSEAYAVQFIGEAMDNIRMLEQSRGRLKERDGKTLKDWQAEVQNLWAENPKLDRGKIENAVAEFRNIYDELFSAMNESRIRNGYEPVNYRSGYFPHFQQETGDGIMAQFGKALGIRMEVTALPTTINGLTHTFRPGIRWMGNALERTGFQTAYDAIEGFDMYIEGAADVIHLTDSIQKLRALATQIRYRTSDDGVREQIDRVRADRTLEEQDKERRIKELQEDSRCAMNNFVVELEEYTNLLANKKSRADRTMEQRVGRNAYNIVKGLENRVAANMVAVNPASWLTNFIPLTQGAAALDRFQILRGMAQTLGAYRTDDGIVDQSTFLTNRRGSDPLVRTVTEKASAALSSPMSWIDCFVADSLVRARYDQNLKKGGSQMSEAAAMEEADSWAAGVMADRSKGSMPTLFTEKNPMTKLFTQFQLEVNNQLSYVLKDIPREKREKGIGAIAAALLKFAIGAFLFNEAYEYLIGRRPALDPIGILNDTVGDASGYQLPNLLELGFGDGISEEDFQTEKEDAAGVITNVATEVLGELPFVGGLLGGGRLPISSALPSVSNIVSAVGSGSWSTEKKLETLAKELGGSLIYLAPPLGGGQIKKIAEAAAGAAQKGVYGLDTDGNQQLKYPIYSDTVGEGLVNLARAATFGNTSLPTGREWVEGGFKSLSADQTAAYQEMMEAGVSGRETYNLICDLRGAEKTEDESAAQVKLRILQESEVSDAGKAVAYRRLLASDKEKALMDELEEGGDLTEVAAALMALKWAGNQSEKLAVIAGRSLSTEEAKALAGFVMGEELTTVTGNTSSYGELIYAVDKGMDISDALELQSSGVDLGDYKTYRDAGLTNSEAKSLLKDLAALEPESGEKSVSDLQRYRAVVDGDLDADGQMTALSILMTEGEYAKLEAGYQNGIRPEDYVTFRERLPQYDSDGNGSYTQTEVQAALDGASSANAMAWALAAGSGSGLTNSQKAVLWQLANKSWKPKNNPYSVQIGQKVYDMLNGS